MRNYLPSNFNTLSSVDKQSERFQASERMQVLGSYRRPDPPTSLVAQPGSRKAVVTWRPPAYTTDIVGWKIYKFNETNLVDTINPSVLQYDVTLDSGSTPPVVNIFISSVNARGAESQKVQVQASATTEAGAPTDPTPPPGDPEPEPTPRTPYGKNYA